MTTPNTLPANGGVSDARLWELRREAKDDPRTANEHWFILFARAAIAEAQSRPPSNQSAGVVEPVALREVVLSLVEAAKCAADNSTPSDILVNGQAVRLLTEGAAINLCAKAAEAETAIREYVTAHFATPPATSGMKEALPAIQGVGVSSHPDGSARVSIDFGNRKDADVWFEYLGVARTPVNQDGLVGDAERMTHLADDAPFLQCTVCGRKSWAETSANRTCGMLQPDESRCNGTMARAGRKG